MGIFSGFLHLLFGNSREQQQNQSVNTPAETEMADRNLAVAIRIMDHPNAPPESEDENRTQGNMNGEGQEPQVPRTRKRKRGFGWTHQKRRRAH